MILYFIFLSIRTTKVEMKSLSHQIDGSIIKIRKGEDGVMEEEGR